MRGDIGQVDRAARGAIARAKARKSAEVTADDLLLGLLGEVSRFGIAWIGDWPIDVASLDGASNAAGGSSATAPAPGYAAETVRVFERGAAIARADGTRSVGAVHLLAAFAEEESPVMTELRRRHGFGPMEWRAALARTDLGLTPVVAAIGGDGDGRPRGGAGEIMSVDDAAAYLAVHAQTIRNYIRSGKLPAYRLAGERSIRVLRQDLLALLEQVRPDEPGETENAT
jgi:excisionase family DNA binding protein